MPFGCLGEKECRYKDGQSDVTAGELNRKEYRGQGTQVRRRGFCDDTTVSYGLRLATVEWWGKVPELRTFE